MKLLKERKCNEIKRFKLLIIIFVLLLQIVPIHSVAAEGEVKDTVWKAEFFDNNSFEGESLKEEYSQLNFDWNNSKPIQSESFSAIFTKEIYSDESIEYDLQGMIDGSVDVIINNESIHSYADGQSISLNEAIQLTKGENIIEIRYVFHPGNSQFYLDLNTSANEDDTFLNKVGAFPKEKWLSISYDDSELILEKEREFLEELDISLLGGNEKVDNEKPLYLLIAKEYEINKSTLYELNGEIKGEYQLFINDELVLEHNGNEKTEVSKEIILNEGKHGIVIKYNSENITDPALNLYFNVKEDAHDENIIDKEKEEESPTEKEQENSDTVTEDDHDETIVDKEKEEESPTEEDQKTSDIVSEEDYDETIVDEDQGEESLTEGEQEQSDIITEEKEDIPNQEINDNFIELDKGINVMRSTIQNNNSSWLGTFYPSKNFTGTPYKTMYNKLDLNWGSGSPNKSIPNDNFTAVFTKELNVSKSQYYRIHGRADDGIRVYVDGKLVINHWKDGVNSFHKDLLLESGKHNIKVEYYEGKYSAAIRVNADPIIDLIGGDWEAAYYKNDSFNGVPMLSQVKKLDLNWGKGSPAKEIPNDNFTATFHKKLSIKEAGEYTFSGRSDDGIRVFVNNKLVINKWNAGVNQYNEKVQLPKGDNLIRVEYLEKKYSAAIRLDITESSKANGEWTATYYPSKNFTGTSYRTTHNKLDLNWGSGSPNKSIPNDNFTAIFTKELNVSKSQYYRIHGRADDGIRVYVDGKQVINHWKDGVNSFQKDLLLESGKHNIKVEYYEGKYSAAIRLDIIEQPKSNGEWTATYYPSKNFTGTPYKTTHKKLDLNWGSGSPNKSIPNDNFSAIFENEIKVSKTGTFHFTGRADDGYRIYLNGKLIINGWKTGVNQINHLIDLPVGTHKIRVEYFDEKYSAAIRLNIEEAKAQPNQWLATYYPKKNMTGLAVKRYEGANLDLNWGSGSPDSGIPVDNFSGIFEKTINISTAGTYQLIGRADDGIRVYVDGKKVIDKWNSGVNQFNQLIDLSKGNHKIKIEYFDEKYSAAIKLDVKKAGKQENHITTLYNKHTYNEALGKQMKTNPPPQTDSYKSRNAFIHKNDVSISKVAMISGSGVRLRTTPNVVATNIYGTISDGTRVEFIKEVNGTIVSGSAKWYEIKYQNRILYIHSSLANLNTSIAKANKTAAVRESANANSHIYGNLKKNDSVTIVKEGTTWHEIKFGTWRNAKQADVEHYFNVNNFKKGTREYYQFLSLKGSSNVNINEINQKILNGKGVLSKKAEAFGKASKNYNINEIYLISHSLLETGNGTSVLAKGVLVSEVDGKPVTPKVVYNVYGIGAKDACALKCGSEYAYKQGWFTVDSAIVGGAKFIGESYIHAGQDTLYKMKWNPTNPGTHQYATDIGWAVKQTTRLYQFYSQLDVYNITFDLPKYK